MRGVAQAGNRGFIVRVSLTLRQKQTFYHELEQFLRSGIPLPQAVEALLPETGYGALRRVLERLLKLFLQGDSVPDAFAKLKPTVGDMEVALISASSNTGRLEQSFIYLSNYFGALDSVRSKIIKGLIWPAVQLHIGVFISNLIPLFIGGLSWNAYVLRCAGTLGACYAAALVLWLGGSALVEMGRTSSALDYLLGRIPLAGKLRRNLALSRFCATYEMQLQGGINIFESLKAAAAASQSARIEATMETVLPQVRTGASYGATLTGKGPLPAALQRAIRLGEETGNLDENLRRWADYYQKAAIGALDAAGVWIPRLFYLLIAGYLIYCIIGAGQAEAGMYNNLLNEM